MPSLFFEPAALFHERAVALVEGESMRIRAAIPAAQVQHIGGTSIAGALTKGDVDVLVTVAPSDFAAAVTSLRALYEINQPENWTSTFASFKDDLTFSLPFGAQLAVEGTDRFQFVRLRDRLINDPAALAAYNEIKRAHTGQESPKYREAKGEFIERLLRDSN
jgi:GrpB-like predicted nucleotidyltransferase (UPF0157 family)